MSTTSTLEAKVQELPLLALTPAPWNPRSIKDDRFRNLCRSLEADPGFLQKLLNSLANPGGLTDPDNIPPLPDEPVTQAGDLWLLGPHRILCGDATNPDHDGLRLPRP